MYFTPESEKLSKEDYLYALDKLKGRDRIGVACDVLTTVFATTGGAVAAVPAASLAGTSTLWGSTWLASSWIGGAFVATTPVGWTIGCAAAAGVVGYGIVSLVRSSQKQDSIRSAHRKKILEKIKVMEATEVRLYDEFIELIKEAVQKEFISMGRSSELIRLVEDGSMKIEIAIDRTQRLICAGETTEN